MKYAIHDGRKKEVTDLRISTVDGCQRTAEPTTASLCLEDGALVQTQVETLGFLCHYATVARPTWLVVLPGSCRRRNWGTYIIELRWQKVKTKKEKENL